MHLHVFVPRPCSLGIVMILKHHLGVGSAAEKAELTCAILQEARECGGQDCGAVIAARVR